MCDCPIAELYAKAAKERDEAKATENKLIDQLDKQRVREEELLNRLAKAEDENMYMKAELDKAARNICNIQ